MTREYFSIHAPEIELSLSIRAAHSFAMDPQDARAYRTLRSDILALFPHGPVRDRWLAWAARLVGSHPEDSEPLAQKRAWQGRAR